MLWFISGGRIFCHLPVYLNTSYVMVHLESNSVFECRMRFKYILCYGSSQVSERPLLNVRNLNTSYVMVHRAKMQASEDVVENLNTSYVMVHLLLAEL